MWRPLSASPQTPSASTVQIGSRLGETKIVDEHMASSSSEPTAPTDKGETKPDERLNFYSDKFDPVYALRCPDLKPPKPAARLYDNIGKFWSAYTGRQAVVKTSTTTTKKEEEKSEASTDVATDTGESSTGRRFLPEQMPVPKKRAKRVNVLTRMLAAKGPTALLLKCRDEKKRIRVWTRHSHGLRGYCEAYLTAFDRFWNMSLQDVEETWSRLKKTKTPPMVASREISEAERRKLNSIFPEVTVIETTKKTETCKRHVSELLVRGEQVAFIVVLE